VDDSLVCRIQKGLEFIGRADRAVIEAARPLQKLEGIAEANPATLLKTRHFRVEGERFEGEMSKQQAASLRRSTKNLKAFAAAIAKVVVKLDKAVVNALDALGGALKAPAKKMAATTRSGNGIQPPPLGCCRYDTTKQPNVTQPTCEEGLGGKWNPGPCTHVPPP
jgi:hypothetical protein